MKKHLSFLFFIPIFLFNSAFLMQTKQQKDINNHFPKGEVIKYSLHYGFVTAGEATVTTDKKFHIVDDKPCYKVDVKGSTVGMFSLAYKVDDLWRSYIDVEGAYPRKFYRDIKENRYRKVETTTFDTKKNKATVTWLNNEKEKQLKKYDIPKETQDMISGYFFLRTIDYSKYKKGDIIKIKTFFQDKLYDFKVVYQGKEMVKTKLGKFSAFKMTPMMPENKLFSGKNAITFWMSNDSNKVPLKIRAKMFVGAIEVEITEYKNQFVHLKN